MACYLIAPTCANYAPTLAWSTKGRGRANRANLLGGYRGVGAHMSAQFHPALSTAICANLYPLRRPFE